LNLIPLLESNNWARSAAWLFALFAVEKKTRKGSPMKFEKPLIEGLFLKRYKRFFADVQIGKETVVAHVPNTGSMKGCNTPNSPCLVSPASNPERKLRYTLEMIKTKTSWVGVNTSHPNKLVHELWATETVKHWQNFDSAQLEVKINKQSRLDLALWDSKEQKNIEKGKLSLLEPPLHFIEIKNVSLAENGQALFPDAVTERGQKHILEMMELMEKGFTCEFVFVIQREDCKSFSPADEIDPEYGKLLRQAHKKGLRISPFACELSPIGIFLKPEPLPLDL
jgi:sugar fermentation stimulation protein A